MWTDWHTLAYGLAREKYCKVPQQSYHYSVQQGHNLPHKRVGDQVVRQWDPVEVSFRLLIRNFIAVPSGQSVVNNLMAKHHMK